MSSGGSQAPSGKEKPAIRGPAVEVDPQSAVGYPYRRTDGREQPRGGVLEDDLCLSIGGHHQLWRGPELRQDVRLGEDPLGIERQLSEGVRAHHVLDSKRRLGRTVAAPHGDKETEKD